MRHLSSQASLCTAVSASQSRRPMPSRAKLMPRHGSGSSAGTSSAGWSTVHDPSGSPAHCGPPLVSISSARMQSTRKVRWTRVLQQRVGRSSLLRSNIFCSRLDLCLEGACSVISRAFAGCELGSARTGTRSDCVGSAADWLSMTTSRSDNEVRDRLELHTVQAEVLELRIALVEEVFLFCSSQRAR